MIASQAVELDCGRARNMCHPVNRGHFLGPKKSANRNILWKRCNSETKVRSVACCVYYRQEDLAVPPLKNLVHLNPIRINNWAALQVWSISTLLNIALVVDQCILEDFWNSFPARVAGNDLRKSNSTYFSPALLCTS